MYEYSAELVSLYDGDTLRFDIDLGLDVWVRNVPCRVYGIDCPEMRTPEGKNARAFAKALLPIGTKVTIKTHKDRKEKFGRWLVEITLHNGESYATRMIAQGHAKVYYGGKR
jgi:micrococcal nuclease